MSWSPFWAGLRLGRSHVNLPRGWWCLGAGLDRGAVAGEGCGGRPRSRRPRGRVYGRGAGRDGGARVVPGTDGRGRDSDGGGCGVGTTFAGGPLPLTRIATGSRRSWSRRSGPWVVGSQRRWRWLPEGSSVTRTGRYVHLSRGVEVAAVDPLTDGRGGTAHACAACVSGELVGPHPVLPDATLVDPVPVILRIHLLPAPGRPPAAWA